MPLTASARAAEVAAINAFLDTLLADRASQPSLDETRTRYDGWGLAYPLIEGTVVEEITLGGVACLKNSPPGVESDAALLYLHGGGYGIGSHRSHQHLVCQLAAASGLTGYGLHYRLAPEAPFPAAVDDAVSAYQALLAQGIAPERIVVAGDSAGGGLTVATALALKQRGIAGPAGLFCISPWANLTQTGPSYTAAASTDKIVSKETLDHWAQMYLGATDPNDPLASPVFGDLEGLAPMLIHVGSDEVLLSDAVLLAERAGLARVPVELVIAPYMPHVWHYMWPQLTDARDAIASAGQWMQAALAECCDTAA